MTNNHENGNGNSNLYIPLGIRQRAQYRQSLPDQDTHAIIVATITPESVVTPTQEQLFLNELQTRIESETIYNSPLELRGNALTIPNGVNTSYQISLNGEPHFSLLESIPANGRRPHVEEHPLSLQSVEAQRALLLIYQDMLTTSLEAVAQGGTETPDQRRQREKLGQFLRRRGILPNVREIQTDSTLNNVSFERSDIDGRYSHRIDFEYRSRQNIIHIFIGRERYFGINPTGVVPINGMMQLPTEEMSRDLQTAADTFLSLGTVKKPQANNSKTIQFTAASLRQAIINTNRLR